MKFALVLILSKFLANRNTDIAHHKNIIISFIYVLLPCLLVLLQPDLGSLIIMLGI